MKYDSSSDTMLHRMVVMARIRDVVMELKRRGSRHDESKFLSPEKEIFDEFTPKLKDSTYGSDEYKEFLKGMGGALDHHYEANRHHPEHFENGIREMNLIDLIEMLADWKAATERHDDGDLFKSIQINAERFKMSADMKHLLITTGNALGWLVDPETV